MVKRAGRLAPRMKRSLTVQENRKPGFQ